MRSIGKQGAGGFYLQQANLNPPADAAGARSRWAAYGHKAALKAGLLDEQYHLCCYSEIRSDQLGLGYHIEHVWPKSSYPTKTFEYGNLAASALDSDTDLGVFKAQSHEVFGGHAKQSNFDAARFVSCHDQGCSQHFAYLSDGRVVAANGLTAADRANADYTIDLLKLNSPFLVVLRRQWWDELDDAFEEHVSRGWDIAQLAGVDLTPTSGRLSRFFSMTRQFFGPVAEQVLLHHAQFLL